MKSLIATSFIFLSMNAFAFTSIELKQDTVLKQNTHLKILAETLSESHGSDYCEISLYSHINADTLKVPAGTVFTVDSIDQNACGHDWGRVCRLDIASSNKDLGVELQLMCKDKGLLAQQLTPSKVNRTAGKIINVK